MTKVRVHRREKFETEFEFVEADRTLLQSLELHGVEIEYHCREGFCGACRCKLKSGAVTYINDPLAYVRDGEILACCSKPSQNIEIELL